MVFGYVKHHRKKDTIVLTETQAPQITDSLDLLTRFKYRNILAGEGLQAAFESWEGDNHVLPRSGLTRADMAGRIERYRQCADMVEMRDRAGKKTVHSANYCRNPAICPICSRRVASRRRAQWFAPIREAATLFPHVYMVTFTVANGDNLGDRYDCLKGALRRFRRMGQARRGKAGRSGGEWGKVRAAVVSDEIVRGRNSGLWHAHAHAVLFCDSPLDYRVYATETDRQDKRPRFTVEYSGKTVPASKMSLEWFEATAGEGLNIHVTPIVHRPEGRRTGPRTWNAEKISALSKMTYADSVATQCCEVLKYTSKVSTLRGPDSLELLDVLYNRRTVTGNGRFHNLPRYECQDCGRSLSGLVVTDPSIHCPDCGGSLLRDNSDEYVENGNRKTDAIYSVRWNAAGGHYSVPVLVDKPVFLDADALDFPDVRRRYAAQSAVMVGRYRSARRVLLESLGSDRSAAAARQLDGLHEQLRDRLRVLWDKYIELVKELYPVVHGEQPPGRTLPANWMPRGKIISLVCWDCSSKRELTNASMGESRTCPDCGGVLVHVPDVRPPETPYICFLDPST